MIVNYLANNPDSLGGAFSPVRLREAFEVSILGLIAVFGVLSLIWLVLAVFKLIFAKKDVVSTTPIKNTSESNPQTATVNENRTADEELNVAIITAAIAAYISSDVELSKQYENGFKVVSFKRVRDKAHWNSK